MTAALLPAECERIAYRRFPKYKWILHEDAVFYSGLKLDIPIEHEYFSISREGVVVARAGYAWDGATGGLDTKSILSGTVVHDIIYQAHQLGYNLPGNWKKVADACLLRICKRDGMTRIRQAWVAPAVEHFGRALPRDLNKYREVYYAP